MLYINTFKSSRSWFLFFSFYQHYASYSAGGCALAEGSHIISVILQVGKMVLLMTISRFQIDFFPSRQPPASVNLSRALMLTCGDFKVASYWTFYHLDFPVRRMWKFWGNAAVKVKILLIVAFLFKARQQTNSKCEYMHEHALLSNTVFSDINRQSQTFSNPLNSQ